MSEFFVIDLPLAGIGLAFEVVGVVVGFYGLTHERIRSGYNATNIDRRWEKIGLGLVGLGLILQGIDYLVL